MTALADLTVPFVWLLAVMVALAVASITLDRWRDRQADRHATAMLDRTYVRWQQKGEGR